MAALLVAKQYAEALLGAAQSQSKVDEIASDMQKIKSFIENSADFAELLSTALLSTDEKKKRLSTLLLDHVNGLSLRLVLLMADNRRLSLLGHAAQGFLDALDLERGIGKAKLYSATELSEATLTKLSDKLTKASGKQLRLETSVNPDLIGGYVVRMDDIQYDASVASQLKRIKESFDNSAYIAAI